MMTDDDVFNPAIDTRCLIRPSSFLVPVPAVYNWVEVRNAFVRSPTRPTYQQLAEEFSVPIGKISIRSVDENWPLMRVQYVESQLRSADAGSVILESVGINRAIQQSAASFGLKMFQRLSETIDKLKPDAAASGDAANLNNIAFAAANTAKALKDAGIVGLPKELADAGKLANGQWNPQLLAAINVTIQNLIHPAQNPSGSAASSSEAQAQPILPSVILVDPPAAEPVPAQPVIATPGFASEWS